MDKSPWDSESVTSILCVSQVMSQKALQSFYKSMSPSPSPPNTMLKDQRNCALTVLTLSVVWGERVGTYSVSSARIQFQFGLVFFVLRSLLGIARLVCYRSTISSSQEFLDVKRNFRGYKTVVDKAPVRPFP